MSKILSIIFLSLSFLVATPSFSQPVYSIQSVDIEAKKLDIRTKILANYFAKYSSPFQYHAQDFIDAADEYDMDWRLVPAIAGVESTFGRFIPGGTGEYSSYNAWGWGVYGTQAIYFESWRDGIFTVSKGLKENYINKGLTNPYSMNRVYAASPAWGWKVDYFLKDLEAFAKDYEKLPEPSSNLLTKVAGSSAQLALR